MTLEAGMPYRAIRSWTRAARVATCSFVKSSPALTHSMPTLRWFIANFPACQAVSDSGTDWRSVPSLSTK